jgi:hypothetical protein
MIGKWMRAAKIAMLAIPLFAATAKADDGGYSRQIQSFTVEATDETLTYPSVLTSLPDEHSTFIPLWFGSYLIFGASDLQNVPNTPVGAVVLQTSDLQTLTFASSLGYNEQVLASFLPPNSCDVAPLSLNLNVFDLNYAAPGTVVQDPAQPPGNMIMIYEAENHCPGGVVNQPYDASIGLARSTDFGHTWPAPVNSPSGGPDRYPVLQIATPQPPTAHPAMGDAVPSAFIDHTPEGDNYLYAIYGYHAAPGGTNDGLMRVARAELGADWNIFSWSFGKSNSNPLQFYKWYNGGFTEPGIGGLDTGVLPGKGCLNGTQAQAEITYNDDLRQYLMIFVCQDYVDDLAGWYYSTATSLDRQDWTEPQLIINSQQAIVTPCNLSNDSGAQFDGWYPSSVSPGAAQGHTKLTGYIFFQNGCETTRSRVYARRAFTIVPK